MSLLKNLAKAAITTAGDVGMMYAQSAITEQGEARKHARMIEGASMENKWNVDAAALKHTRGLETAGQGYKHAESIAGMEAKSRMDVAGLQSQSRLDVANVQAASSLADRKAIHEEARRIEVGKADLRGYERLLKANDGIIAQEEAEAKLGDVPVNEQRDAKYMRNVEEMERMEDAEWARNHPGQENPDDKELTERERIQQAMDDPTTTPQERAQLQAALNAGGGMVGPPEPKKVDYLADYEGGLAKSADAMSKREDVQRTADLFTRELDNADMGTVGQEDLTRMVLAQYDFITAHPQAFAKKTIKRINAILAKSPTGAPPILQ